MNWTEVGNAALGVLATVITTAGALLIPLARDWIKEKLLASKNARLAAAAETIAAEIERGLIGTMDFGVAALRRRLADTTEGVGDDVLRGLIAKGRERLKQVAPDATALAAREGRS